MKEPDWIGKSSLETSSVTSLTSSYNFSSRCHYVQLVFQSYATVPMQTVVVIRYVYPAVTRQPAPATQGSTYSSPPRVRVCPKLTQNPPHVRLCSKLTKIKLCPKLKKTSTYQGMFKINSTFHFSGYSCHKRTELSSGHKC